MNSLKIKDCVSKDGSTSPIAPSTADGSTSPILVDTSEMSCSAVADTRDQATSPTPMNRSEWATSPITTSSDRGTSPIDFVNELHRNHPNMSLFPRDSKVECKIQ